jgi:hypothetical protein
MNTHVVVLLVVVDVAVANHHKHAIRLSAYPCCDGPAHRCYSTVLSPKGKKLFTMQHAGVVRSAKKYTSTALTWQ